MNIKEQEQFIGLVVAMIIWFYLGLSKEGEIK